MAYSDPQTLKHLSDDEKTIEKNKIKSLYIIRPNHINRSKVRAIQKVNDNRLFF